MGDKPNSSAATSWRTSYLQQQCAELIGRDHAVWPPTIDIEFHPGISARTRFPKPVQRYSTRFGLPVQSRTGTGARDQLYDIGSTGSVLDDQHRRCSFYGGVGNVITLVVIDTSGYFSNKAA